MRSRVRFRLSEHKAFAAFCFYLFQHLENVVTVANHRLLDYLDLINFTIRDEFLPEPFDSCFKGLLAAARHVENL